VGRVSLAQEGHRAAWQIHLERGGIVLYLMLEKGKTEEKKRSVTRGKKKGRLILNSRRGIRGGGRRNFYREGKKSGRRSVA